MGGGLLLGRRQARGSREPHPRPCRLPAHPPARHTSSPAGLASSAHTATAPGPRAAAVGAGAGRRTPPCTRPFRLSSGPRVGPRGQQPACRGGSDLLPGQLVLAVCRPRGPVPPPPTLAPGAAGSHGPPRSLAGSPQPPRACGGSEDQGRLRAGISTVSRAGGQEPQGSLSTCSPQGLAHSRQGEHSTSTPRPQTLTAPQPCGGSGPEPGHTAQRSLEHLVGLWEQRGPSASGPPPPPPELGWTGSSPGPAPSSWTPAVSAPAPGLACSRVNGGTGSKSPC